MHVTSVSGECLSDGRYAWKMSADCCSWGGVTWDATGRVVSLDLSSESFLQNSTSWNLNYLNLSNAGFSGQIPIRFLLDKNLKELRELHLSGVNISPRERSGAVIFIFSAKSQALSLSSCFFSGPLILLWRSSVFVKNSSGWQ
ncbi:hypothetical protein CK203_100935 [Vitis vinifera]|uniref:Uncharacterized protein n=1 Tax=Vitis vinifera TaxID=29760 RepID=A0A438CJE1_VITVI|nr:hypothetical protein CK203_100935 [Vitis vinifera]